MPEKKLKYLVADTTAFINNVQLQDYAENVLTVPDVVNEVKNKRQIRRLVVLPFDLKVQEPDEESLQIVTNFSKKTGDYASLSAIDLKVIALTYQLEKENIGSDHLRKEPVVSRIVASKNKPEELIDNTKVAGFYIPSKGEKAGDNEEEQDEIEEDEVNEDLPQEGDDSKIPKNDTLDSIAEATVEDNDEITVEMIAECMEKITCEDSAGDDILVPETKQNDPEVSTVSEDDDDESEEDESDDDDDAWITPTNISKVKKEFSGDLEEECSAVVACMSTDFAIQNVLKQINLNVASLNGRLIKHLRTYILRCYACFKTTSIMSKMFCPNCGNKTLKRVAVSLDENGQQVIHINTRRPLTSKYKNQSLPRPKGGKHSRNPILVEDQPIPRQMPSRVAKTKTNALDEDYIAGLSPFVTRDVNSKSALLRSKGNVKQWARNNTYEEGRRKRSFNRLVK